MSWMPSKRASTGNVSLRKSIAGCNVLQALTCVHASAGSCSRQPGIAPTSAAPCRATGRDTAAEPARAPALGERDSWLCLRLQDSCAERPVKWSHWTSAPSRRPIRGKGRTWRVPATIRRRPPTEQSAGAWSEPSQAPATISSCAAREQGYGGTAAAAHQICQRVATTASTRPGAGSAAAASSAAGTCSAGPSPLRPAGIRWDGPSSWSCPGKRRRASSERGCSPALASQQCGWGVSTAAAAASAFRSGSACSSAAWSCPGPVNRCDSEDGHRRQRCASPKGCDVM